MRRAAYSVALCGLLAALGTAVMLAAGIIPILTYCSPLAASLLLIPVLRELGRGRAWMTWAVTAALSGILCADKEAACFYIFLGYYPILKPAFDALGRAGWWAKLLYFAASVAVMYGLILFVLKLDAGIGGPLLLAALWVALTAIMLVFDFAIRRMTLLYERRLGPLLRKRLR